MMFLIYEINTRYLINWVSIRGTQRNINKGLNNLEPRQVNISDRLWQKQAFGEKISFADFSLELINNKFWLKCWKNYYSIFIGSRDMNFLMLSYSKLQFREKRVQSWLIQIEILSSACVVYLEVVGTATAKRPNEVIFRKLNA